MLETRIEIPDEPKVLETENCLKCNRHLEPFIDPAEGQEGFSSISVICTNCGWTGAAYIPRITIYG